MTMNRRTLIRAGGLALAGMALPFPALASSVPRALSLDNIHTGEKLKVTYWERGRYLPDALSEVNRVLRDFRSGEIYDIDPRLLDLLTNLHGCVESRAPYQIISGYRSPRTNAGLRGASRNVAKRSYHMKGMAIDVRLGDCQLKNLHAAARSLKAGGVGMYPGPDFVHVDVGPVRYW